MLAPSLAAALLATAVSLPQVSARSEPELWKRTLSRADRKRTCAISDAPPTVKAPYQNPWAQISATEVSDVWNFVHTPEVGLNLTDPAVATVTDNYVFWIDTLREFY